jgi:hypothetical protein
MIPEIAMPSVLLRESLSNNYQTIDGNPLIFSDVTTIFF